MAYSLEPRRKVTRSIRAVARERSDIALESLDGLHDRSPDDIERSIHDARKRCKELRALGRLVGDELGDGHREFDAAVRSAARELASFRDAHAVLGVLDDLSGVDDAHAASLAMVRSAQASVADAATSSIRAVDPRIDEARDLLRAARRQVRSWKVDPGTDWLRTGLGTSYRKGRRAMRRALADPTDDRLHRWRSSVKTLWYQVRLIESASPSMLSPLVDRLAELGEALGDDHDLAVLAARIEADPLGFGPADVTRRTIELARRHQADLRRRAFRMGASVYAESSDAFVERMVRYWELACRLGPELPTGGLAELAAAERAAPPRRSLERERKFLVDELPDLGPGEHLRQGYLAIDGAVSLRVRSVGGERCTVTLKAGRGAVRRELEWALTAEQFDALWEFTENRRIDKTRHCVPLAPAAVEGVPSHADLDVFHGRHEGLVVVEVEFESTDALAGFVPPVWFGREVTDDPSYTNAALSTRSPDPKGPPT